MTTELTPSFKWRCRHGRHISVSDMDTRHLFNTLSMIWNHTMPEDAKTHNYKRYSFSGIYTEPYLKQAIVHMLQELLSREDLNLYQRGRLVRMADYFNKKITEKGEPEKWVKLQK